MLKIDRYIYTCHRNIVSLNHNKSAYRAPRSIHINKWTYTFREQINIWYDYYTNECKVKRRQTLIDIGTVVCRLGVDTV